MAGTNTVQHTSIATVVLNVPTPSSMPFSRFCPRKKRKIRGEKRKKVNQSHTEYTLVLAFIICFLAFLVYGETDLFLGLLGAIVPFVPHGETIMHARCMPPATDQAPVAHRGVCITVIFFTAYCVERSTAY